LDQGKLIFPKAGVPQGGPLSPLLANVALHGLEKALVELLPKRKKPSVIRYADDLVVLHPDREAIERLRQEAEKWLAPIGLRLKASKTRIGHTLQKQDGQVGFDFLGFHVRQYPVGKHRTATYRGKTGYKTLIKPSKTAQKRQVDKLRQVIRKHRGNSQAALISELVRIIRGWANYYRPCAAKKTFARMDHVLFHQLCRWAAFRHNAKSKTYRYQRYWRQHKGRIRFSDGRNALTLHQDIRIRPHVKVKGIKSPFDGDWVYWAKRLGRDKMRPNRLTTLVKKQEGKCSHCGLYLTAEEVMEIHHRDGNRWNTRYSNLTLLHGHCHDQIHARGKRYL
jgi:RNA-directed DNA polymerase